VELLRNYLTGRKQQIKLQGDLSSWADIQKGVPQGSILGPLFFKFFINDIFYFIEYGTLLVSWHVSYCQLQWLETYLD
jgi:hypothetical protein